MAEIVQKTTEPEQKPDTTLKLQEDEKKALLGFFEKQDLEMLKTTAQAISMFVNALEGRPIEAEDIITRLINVKNKMERSRFPTYPLLAKQVYLRLIAHYNPQGEACKEWADYESEALIAYKGLNWDAYVEMAKAATGPQEQQQFYFGGAMKEPLGERGMNQPKKRFWQKNKQATESSEFEAT